ILTMAAKRNNPDQPDLPIEGVPNANVPAPSEPKPAKNGNGGEHVQAEPVDLPPARPFVPGKIELPLHKRVNRSFLDYASYVIRDRAIPNLSDGLKPVQRRILR